MGLLSIGRRKEDAAGDDSEFAAPAAEAAAKPRPKSRKKSGGADPVDPVLPEKQRARRRLIGAVALVLAAVIGLPMILDSEPKPLASDISIDIPSKDKARPAAKLPASAALDQGEEISEADAAPAKPADSKSADNKAVADKPAEAKAGDGKAADQAADAKPAAAAPAPAAALAKVDNGKPAAPEARAEAKAAEHKPEPKAEARAKPESKDAAHKADDARAKAILDGHDPDKAHAENYMVQVAALASPDKVRELQDKLKAAGIKSSTQKVATQSGERIRVRVGPVRGRAEAEKMRARLVKLGLNGTLVPA